MATKTKKRAKAIKKFRRVQPGRIEKAYADTGLTPTQRNWLELELLHDYLTAISAYEDAHDEGEEAPKPPLWKPGVQLNGEACGLMVLAVHKTILKKLAKDRIDPRNIGMGMIAKYLGLKLSYVLGFTQGFDRECEAVEQTEEAFERFKNRPRIPMVQGVLDGIAAAERLKL